MEGRIVSGSRDKTIRIWDAKTGEVVCEPFKGHTDWINSVAFSPDGTRIVFRFCADVRFRIWNAETGEVVSGHSRGTLQNCQLGCAVALMPSALSPAMGRILSEFGMLRMEKSIPKWSAWLRCRLMAGISSQAWMSHVAHIRNATTEVSGSFEQHFEVSLDCIIA